MKLWQKVFLFTLLFVMAVIALISILLLDNNYNVLIDKQMKSSSSEHAYLESNVKNKVITERIRSGVILLSEQDVYSIIENIFKKDDSKEETGISFYTVDGERFYSNYSIGNESELLPSVIDTNKPHAVIKEVSDESYLFVASAIILENVDYIFITSTNITDIYDIYAGQLSYVKWLSLILAFTVAVLLLLIVRLLMYPLHRVNRTTKSIAKGRYNIRVKVKGKNELSELAHNMNIMAQAVEDKVKMLEAAAKNREAFIANLTHEMKTPLTSILGFADVLRIKEKITDDERVEYAGIIVEETKRLRLLSGKLLELIMIGETCLDMKIADTNQIFSDLEMALLPIAQTRDIYLEFTVEEGVIYTDEAIFKSMIYNIVDNAVKASKENDAILINAYFEHDFFVIKVKDEGVGIASADLEKVREPFFMADKVRTRKEGGAGLGLALCDKIAKIHGGELQIHSEAGKGTEVIIRIAVQHLNEKERHP